MNFESLFREEQEFIRSRRDDKKETPLRISEPGPAGEPWVVGASMDRVGLALSGGGIRSATFNLGLLQGLNRFGILDHVDYLSSVSGGGYVGGFWSAWRKQTQGKFGTFPESDSRAIQKLAATLVRNRSDEVLQALADYLDHALSRPEFGTEAACGNEPWLNQCREILKRLDDGSRVPQAGETTDQLKREKQDGKTPADGPLGKALDEWLKGKDNSALTTPLSKLCRALEEIEGNRETAEVRHLREFSNFLAPRLGMFQPETWSIIVSVLSGTIPAFVVSTAVLAAGALLWAKIATVLVSMGSHTQQAVTFAALTAAIQFVSWRFKTYGPAPKPSASRLALGGIALLATGLATAAWWFGRPLLDSLDSNATKIFSGIPLGALFAPAFAWTAALLAMIFLRPIGTSVSEEYAATIGVAADRVMRRLLAPAVLWSIAAFIWIAPSALSAQFSDSPDSISIGAAIGTLTCSAIFAWARKWLTHEIIATRDGRSFLGRHVLFQILAILATLMLAVFVTALLTQLDIVETHLSGACASIAAALGGALLFFHPSRIGLHEFYRSRISRTYLGASIRTKPEDNRNTEEGPQDDVSVSKLDQLPLHLICCAGNDIKGDVVSSLYRGACSVTISPIGVAVANSYCPWKDMGSESQLRLSSCLTASAAAFNSNMGSLSVKLGPAVAFLTTTLNLRLGLWIRHPLSHRRQARLLPLPGLLFLKELFGFTHSQTYQADAGSGRRRIEPFSEDLHLSDGGHFENLGLYELLRRHCRYIILSDCGADATVSFNDFGNTLRRVREDFGIEIEIDLEPLRPSSTRSSERHLAIGVIHYDSITGTDKGTLLYFKPALSGGEPCDVTQYASRNRAFPHESTVDQFYDEAQWEAYRRLGEHTAHTTFRFLERLTNRVPSIDEIFRELRQQWYPTIRGYDEAFLQLTDRCARLESDLRTSPLAALRAEHFQGVRSRPTSPPDSGAPSIVLSTVDSEIQCWQFLFQVTQVMEDAWLGCKLDEHWNHPMNQGWVNYIGRWTAVESFRRWWPILNPLFSPGFRRFMEERFGVAIKHGTSTDQRGFRISEPLKEITCGLAFQHLQYLQPPKSISDVSGKWFTYDLHLSSDGERTLQLGIVYVKLSDPNNPEYAAWDSCDFYVSQGYWGTGIGTEFLKALLRKLKWEWPKLEEVQVRVTKSVELQHCENVAASIPNGDSQAKGDAPQEHPTGERTRSDAGARQELMDLISFYKGVGFDHPARSPMGRSSDDGDMMVYKLCDRSS